MKQMNQAEGWLGASIGGSFYGGDIKMLTTSFSIIVPHDQLELDYWRREMVKGIEIFLHSINTTPILTSYLNHHPFTYKDLDYGLSFYSTDGKWLGHTFLIKGKISYFEIDETEHTHEVHEEPYLEALEKVRAGLPSVAPQLVSAE